jgi:hypothetical protein
MTHKEQHEIQRQKERALEKRQRKQRGREVEAQEKKSWMRMPRPFGLIVIGILLTTAIVASWIFWMA